MNRMRAGWVVRGLALSILLVRMGNPAQAEDLRFRARLDYQNLSRPGLNSSHLLQEYNVTAVDELFMKNIVTISLRWNRIDDFQSHEGVAHSRLRLGLRGTAYEASLLYTPPHFGSVGARQMGQKSDSFLATWQYRPAGHPQLRFEYRQNQRTQLEGALEKTVSASRQRMFQLDHDLGPLKIGGSYRVRNSSGSFASSDREIRSGLLRAGIHHRFGRSINTDLAADFQRTDTDQHGRTDLIRTANLRFGAMWTANPKLMASLSGFLRDILSEQTSVAHSVNNSRELAARCVYRPTPPVQLEVRRDIRRTRNMDSSLYSDLLRMQASYAGTVRKGLKGRLNLVKNVTVRTENMATPSDNMDLTLDFKLYRRTTVRAFLTMSRFQHRDANFKGRYSSIGTVELRSRLTRRVVTNLTFRNTDISPVFVFMRSDVRHFSGGINYTSPLGLTFSGTVRRTIMADSPVRPQTSVNGNLSLRFNTNITLTIDGAWNESGTSLGNISATTFNTRLQLRLGRSTNAILGYQETKPGSALPSHSVTGSLTANF